MEEKEVWEDIVGYEGLYQITNCGKVKSLGRFVFNNGSNMNCFIKCKILKCSVAKIGYIAVSLHKNKKFKRFRVHRLVAINFIPNPENKPFINHIDGDKLNNFYKNLEWCTPAENNRHAIDTGLKSPTWKGRFGKDHCRALKVNKLSKDGVTLKTYPSIMDAEIDTGIYHNHISRVCLKRKGHLTAGGFKWEYVND